MSGSSHQRKVVETAIASAIRKMGNRGAPPASIIAENRLGRSSVEAYLFFIVATGYAITSALGLPVNFWAGFVMSVFVAAASIDLLWRSLYAANWNRWAKSAGTVLIAFLMLVIINAGYVRTHRIQNPNADTLNAIQNLGVLIGGLRDSISNNGSSTTVIVEPDGRYPDIELDEPVDKTTPGGPSLINVEATNVGNATARTEMSTVGLFTAPRGSKHEDSIFNFLYTRENDPTSEIPYGDLAPKRSETIPIGGPLRREDGSLANDADRMALFSKANVFYVSALVSYQDTHGRAFHRELCYFYTEPTSISRKCNSHNGQGVQ